MMGAASLAPIISPLDALSAQCTIDLPIPDAPEDETTVGIARDVSVDDAVRAAVEMAGGLGEIKSGQTVVIKPNIMGPDMVFGIRTCTHPEVMGVVIRLVKERTSACNIKVAEACPMKLPTKFLARQSGMLDVCINEGVEFIGWESKPYSYVTSKHFEYISYDFHVPSSILNGSYDHFIAVPILKNHEAIPETNVDFTCCIKLHVGTMHPFDRIHRNDVDFIKVNQGERAIHNFGIHHKNLGEACAEINLAVPNITMNIVDALSPIYNKGPGLPGMEFVDANLIIASKDRVASDSLGLAVLKYYALQGGVDKPYVTKSVWDQAQIRRAQELNLGRAKDKIGVDHLNVEEIEGILTQWV